MTTDPFVSDLRAAPFDLRDEQVHEVERLLAGMTPATKAAQLFCLYLTSDDMAAWTARLDRAGIQPGGFMLLPRSVEAARDDVRALQAWSPIPLLIAANLESGSVNFLTDTEPFGTPMQLAATRDPEQARRLAVHCGRIAEEVGINWAFAPVVDVVHNHRNPITNTRAFGSDPELVATMAETYVREIESRRVATSVKHFPGDGVDDRDQHLVTTNNSLDVESWESSFGEVYRRMFAAGASTVMAGHIRLPAYSRLLVPGIADVDLEPATLAPELLRGLLRDRLRFNGLVITDNSGMAGMTSRAPRAEGLVRAILSGNDMILGSLDLESDVAAVCEAIVSGAIPADLVDAAVRRVLALKFSLGLFDAPSARRNGPHEVPDAAEEQAWRRELADASVTLVKDTQQLLPLDPVRHRRALVYVLGDAPTFYDPSGGFASRFIDGLRARGLDVTVRQVPGEWRSPAEAELLHLDFDVCLYFANVKFAGNSNTLRLAWTPPQGPDAPRHVATLPTALVSIADPYLLQDVPMIRTAVNGYTPSAAVVDASVAKLFGETGFLGSSPVDPFGGYWDAAL